ncbi:MAG: nucleoside triphosphate pyrophosphohydrolase [Flavobacteriales bacterium]|nr:nucleoside triphosphate pyrophosphohydrolase [Flavobacteriales bacterium]
MDERLIAFKRLLDIMDDLRAKCPWDKEQTIASIRHLTIEETYELSDAILKNDMNEIAKELGDLALHIVFYSKIASETNEFDITTVLNGICEKLIRRHPHIYGNVVAYDAATVKQNWEQIKQKESKGEKSVLDGVPNSMPSLVKALRMQEKAAQVGFDWPNKNLVWDKVEEELNEFKQATANEKSDEFGDLLFSLVNYARWQNINPDDALESTNKKFKHRFEAIENYAKHNNLQLKQMTLEQMEEVWQKAK